MLMRVLAASIFVSAFAMFAFAQDDPDPNSPTPVLLSVSDSARALAVQRKGSSKVDLTRVTAQAFVPGSKINLYVTNLALMDGEGANAFRTHAVDANGHNFRFPVIDLREVPTMKGVFAVTVLLTDELGLYAPPTDGDLMIGVTWRGLISNMVKLGYGQMGGSLKDDPKAKPTPISSLVVKKGKYSPRSVDEPGYVGYKWSGDRSRFLEQAAFGPTIALDNRIRRIGLKTWLAEQFNAAPPSGSANCASYPTVTDPLAYPCQPLKTSNAGADATCNGNVATDVPPTCFRDTYSMYPIQLWNTYSMLYSDNQLRHRVAWALSEIMVTSGVDIQQSRHMVEYHKILSANAFGNYRNLMRQMTLDPTMGDYLSMAGSTKNNPNENYAREIMQLFTIGLFMLNQDGTYQLDGQGNPIPTYDQNTVNNLTRVFTGWNFCQTSGATCPNLTVGTVNYIDPMILNTANHDVGTKTLLSYTGSTTTNVAGCTGCTSAQIATYADNSLNQALDNIFFHPSLGPYVSKLLIEHMVTSDPTPAYVSRVAGVFNNNGFGVRGDLQAVVKAILLDPEARGDFKSDPNYGKLREPVQLATNLMRTFNPRSADGSTLSDGNIVNLLTSMSQTPFRSPTVFNYFPQDYTVPGTTLRGPEYALMNTGTSIARANFINRAVFTSPMVSVSLPDSPNGTSLDFSDIQALSAADSTGNLMMDELNRRMLHGTLTAQNRSTILTAVTAVASSDPLGRARQAIYLIATSSQYQVQR